MPDTTGSDRFLAALLEVVKNELITRRVPRVSRGSRPGLLKMIPSKFFR